jgi:hypothetical protein
MIEHTFDQTRNFSSAFDAPESRATPGSASHLKEAERKRSDLNKLFAVL